MKSDLFLDTNVLVYFLDAGSTKADQSERLIRAGATISVQVLNEFVNAARRKYRMPIADIRLVLSGVKKTCAVVPVTVNVHERGVRLIERYQFSANDSMIVAAALEAGCTTLLTEDMNDGQVIDGLTIRNPYAAA